MHCNKVHAKLTLTIWDHPLKATKHATYQFQAMYVSHTEIGAIALGQSYKTLQHMVMLLSFKDTNQEIGGHHECIQICHQSTGEMYIIPSHMHRNRWIRCLNVDNLVQSNPRGVHSCCRSCC